MRIHTQIKYLKKNMEINEWFLEQNKILDEFKNFYKEVIRNTIKFTGIQNPSNWAMRGFILTIYQPLSYGIYIELLIGNLFTCFFQLRLLLEELAKHYLADVRYPYLCSNEKLKRLEKSLKNISFSKLMEELDKNLFNKNTPQLYKNKDISSKLLYQHISEKWIHKKEKERLCITLLLVPVIYTERHLPQLKEFRNKLLSFKEISNKAIKSWEILYKKQSLK